MLNDILLLDEQLTEEELAVQKTAKDYCEKLNARHSRCK